MIPLLSVIIPVYNVEDYLERCVKSVINQDFRSIEVILVDDGSSDRCPQICDDLAKTDERITVIHKINGGLSSARNIGIAKAVGEYITFLDSDDQWIENALTPIMEYAIKSETDMLMFTSLCLYPDGSIMRREYGGLGQNTYQVFKADELYNKLIQNGNLREQAGTHIIRTEFLKENNLLFTEGILCEDTDFMFRIMRRLTKVAITDKDLLIYTEKRPGSITNTISVKRLKDLVGVIQNSIEYYDKNSNDRMKTFELAQCSYLWTIALGYCSLLTNAQSKEIQQILKRQIVYLKLSSHPKSKMVGYLISVFGFTLTSYILGTYMNLHTLNLLKNKKKVNE